MRNFFIWIVCGLRACNGFVSLHRKQRTRLVVSGRTIGVDARELGERLNQRIRENENPELWRPVYDAFRGIDMKEWVVAVEQIAKTQDGSREAALTLEEWEKKFNETATAESEEQEKATSPPTKIATASPQEGSFGSIVVYLREYADEGKWNDMLPVVTLHGAGVPKVIQGKELQESLNEMVAKGADIEQDGRRLWMSIETSAGVGLLVVNEEKDWVAALKKTGLLKEIPVPEIKKLLDGTLEFELSPSFNATGLKILPYDVNFVKVKTPLHESPDWKTLFDGVSSQLDKSRVKVVAGESGSGKTTFASLAPFFAVPETAVLYAKPTRREVFLFAEEAKGEAVSEAVCRSISVLSKRDDVKSTQLFCERLGETNKLVRFSRNQKAFDIALGAWKRAAFTFEELAGWWESGTSPLPHLTMVLDEAAQLDLVRAIVAIGRLLCRHFVKIGLAESIDIVLVGTGLERVDDDEPDITVTKYGSDKEAFAVILLETPDLAALSNSASVKSAHMFGVENGVYSRVLATNTRMLFRAVLPIIQQPYHTENLKEISEKPEERLKAVGSTRILMDYAIRLYLTQNSVGGLKTNKTTYVDACFHYHLFSSQEAVSERLQQEGTNHSELSKLRLVKRKAKLGDLEEQLFDLGLARSDGATSKALKLLACFGLANALNVSDGDSFEELVGYHLARQAQVWDGCNSYLFGKLENSWPPQTKSNQTELGSAELVEKLVEMNIDGASEKNFCETLKARLREHDAFSVTFWQGGQNAQGPDVFHLKVAGRLATLHIFQCKNSPKPSWADAWRAVGVAHEGNRSYAVRTDGSSAYSRIGVQKLCEHISSGTGLHVDVGERVVVISRNARKRDFGLQLPDDCRLVTRELLEPTISCLEAPEVQGGHAGAAEEPKTGNEPSDRLETRYQG